MDAVVAPQTLADLLPRVRVRTPALVIGFALLTAVAAQITIPLPWTPVPVTGQTFAVLVAGAALGWRRGAASQLLYVAMGAVGLPFYADGASGWDGLSGATGGYLVGFVIAAALVGALAERRHDRSVRTPCPPCSPAPPSSTCSAPPGWPTASASTPPRPWSSASRPSSSATP